MIKEITPYNFDEMLFDYFEGNLNESEKSKFLEFIDKNPSYKEDLKLWEEGIVASDNIEVPEGLEKLFMKKESFWKSLKGKIIIAIAVAVGVTTAVIVSRSNQSSEVITTPQIENDKENQTVEPKLNYSAPVIIEDINEEKINEPDKKNTKTIKADLPVVNLPDNKEVQNLDEDKTTSDIDTPESIEPLPVDKNDEKEKVLIKPVIKEQEQKAKELDDLKSKDKKLGTPKNIVPMPDKLGE